MEDKFKKHVVYAVYRPDGVRYTEFTSRKKAKKFIDEKNCNTPGWHYDELWKYQAYVVSD